MAFTRDVLIRLPGPNDGGDTWGVQWAEPGVISPGSIEIRAKIVKRFANGDAHIELEGKRRRFQPDDELATDYTYKFTGKLRHDVVSSIRKAVGDHKSSSNLDLARIANFIQKLLDDDVEQSDINSLLSIVKSAGSPDDKITAMLLLALIATNEL